ncbi:ATP-dependent RNA helicase [Giardia muris]|uniref:ATP-dependent RNA helicase n=1 Tax=Giardia muris TaxID=5742 RepID=A0A4Z1T1U7_GIAMU|nr:ATP-dependent RNA helicase [Giardia muris]|eukprot:TNJ26361.1 ATP-dependent RNA helicase [Giardia muris]
MKTWEALHLSRPMSRAVSELGWAAPTPVQAKAIPVVLAGRDTLVTAQTGSGKTGAFGIPVLERMLLRGNRTFGTTALVLSPTRELALQTASVLKSLARYTAFAVETVIGGVGGPTAQAEQEARLRRAPDVIVATPGRLIDMLLNSFGLGDLLASLEVFVIDECDKMLGVDFQRCVEELCRVTPSTRQTLLFSATLDERIVSLAVLALQKPIKIAIDPPHAVASSVQQQFVQVQLLMSLCASLFSEDPWFQRQQKPGQLRLCKDAILVALLRAIADEAGGATGTRTLVFCNSRYGAQRLELLLRLLGPEGGIERDEEDAEDPEKAKKASKPLLKQRVTRLGGDSSQAERLQALEAFKDGRAEVLVATDVAARGLDVEGVDVVIEYDAPRVLEEHIHRAGRTGRALATGVAIVLVTDADEDFLSDLKRAHSKGASASNTLLARKLATEPFRRVLRRFLRWDVEERVDGLVRERRLDAAIEGEELRVRRAENMLQHRDAILARPRRTWFQTAAEKRLVDDLHARVSTGELSQKAALKELSKDAQNYLKKTERQARFEAARGSRKTQKGLTPEILESIKEKKRAAHLLRTEGSSLAQQRLQERKEKRSKAKGSGKAKRKEGLVGDMGPELYLPKKRSKPSASGFKSKKRYKRR